MDTWFGHTVMRPRTHSSHVPQGIAAITWTRSPGCHPSTALPTSTTSPAISWPMTRGGSRFWCPAPKILTSVPQVEQACTLIFTSCSDGEGSSASSTRRSPGA